MNVQSVFNKIKNWFKDNRLVALYALFAIAIEHIAVFVVEDKLFLSRPFISIGILVFFLGVISMLNSEKAKFAVCTFFLVIQALFDLIFVLIYDMTGQYFYYEMLNLRNDAIAALDSIPVNFAAFYSGLFFCLVYIVYGLRTLKMGSVKVDKKNTLIYKVVVCIVGIITVGASVMTYYPRSIEDRYEQMINGKTQKLYSSYGMIGNMIGEFGSKMWERRDTPDDATMEAFLYANDKVSTPTNYFGTAKGKNVVVILAESFEWFAFLHNDLFKEKYPNALPFTEEELETLFPNLTKFYNESVIASNFHSREKTDISETLSIMGSYPLDAYVSYDYSENVMPTALPNILDITEGEMQKRSFHNGDKIFYNRIQTHLSFGFDEEMMDKFDMADYAQEQAEEGEEPTFTNYDDFDELNLDSQMIETCKDLMFPKDERFFTYITSITMHGVYYERNNLQEHRKKFVELVEDRVPTEEDDEALVLFDYMTSAMEFDLAIGKMMEDLEQKEILDDTMIVLFGDHNAYYQSLSSYVKDIEDYATERKYTDLYNVPLMIYDQDLFEKVPENKRVIDKFTCTSDLVPTILDLLGIKYYENMFYGTSIFLNKQSVLYSRAYDIFVGDGIIGNSVNDIVYSKDLTKQELLDFQKEATALVEKMKYCDYIFIKDWFRNKARLEKFQEKMSVLNDET